jgi:hypothetical protein
MAAWSAPPSDQLLPATTRGYVAVPDVEGFRERWRQTQLGQLAADPIMKPFAEDLQRQIREKFIKDNLHLELDWEDLAAMAAGELALATIQPGGDETQHASVLILDVTGRETELNRVFAEASRQLDARGGQRTAKNVGNHEVITYILPHRRGELAQDRVVRTVARDLLIVGNHEGVVLQILERLVKNQMTQGLSEVAAYRQINQRVAAAAGAAAPQLRWYIEPIGYAEVVRAAQGGQRKRGRDMLAILKSQGFDAIQGAGGWLELANGEQEFVHRTFIYAPGTPGTGSRFEQAARLLDFPNHADWQWPAWVPRELATATQFNWKVREAFEHSKTLVDAVAGDEGFFEDMLDSIANDPNGPQIDIRQELVSHLGQEVTVVTDYVFPITPQSERMVVAIKVSDEVAVRNAIQKVLEEDPDARRLEMDGQTIWEIVDQDNGEGPDLDLNIDGIDPIGGPVEDEGGDEPQILRNSALTVAKGYFYVATHVDFLRRLLQERPADDQLADAEDLQLVQDHLKRIGAGTDSLRSFSRTDEAYRVTYELIRQGRMPEAESLLGRILNRALGPEDEDVLRQQSLDGSQLPAYEAVRRYLGPAGTYMQSEADGWYLGGVLLNKHAYYPDQDRTQAGEQAALPLQPARTETVSEGRTDD